MNIILYRIEDKTKNSKIESKKNKIIAKECWFCQKPCFKFVSICNNCENDRIRKKNKKNI